MIYLLDTVALIRHLSGDGKIGSSAKKIFDQFDANDDSFVISVITIMEILYLSEKGRINIDFFNLIDVLNKALSYKIIDLNLEILKVAATLEFYELHDRMILATAKWLDIPIISSDKKFKEVAGINLIWK